eukprot:jgi/Mesvir1/24992/Mv16950-RA.1
MPLPDAVLRCKVALIGDPAVGKSALANMFQSKGTNFLKNYRMTAGVEVVVCPVPIPDTSAVVELFLFDTGGQDIFNDMTSKYWEGINTFILCYDATNMKSFDSCEKWFTLVQKLRPDKPIPGILVANKIDLQERISVDVHMAASYAEGHGMKFFACSAMPPGGEIEAPFHYIANTFYKSYEEKIKKIVG